MTRAPSTGLVVRRQTEILLEEAALLRSRLLHERAVDDCVRDIALYDPDVVDAETVEARLGELGVDPRRPRTAVVLDVRACGVSRMSLLRTVREVFGGGQDVAGELAAGRYLVLRAEDAALVERCSALVERLRDRHAAEARAGIGEPGRGVTGMHDSYRDAALALRAGPRLDPDGRVYPVTGLRVPQLVASVVRQERARYAAVLLAGLREREDWPVLRETLIAWAECGCRLVGTAERLAIHRNTLLYRLTKIEELSGREVREPRTAMGMYLACLADAL
ncbi:helix-turn-helix domain-containing protein [Streptomyces sp. NPDC048420]|uniref:PucR family transcriptional regulator n=1 Tax=Streptomyces sp. NPDC048420 TaxID=3155755 RepID=UPI003438DF16